MAAPQKSLRSRKVLGFCAMAVAVILVIAVSTKLGTPDPVSTQALWVIGMGGLFLIGGQALVDSVTNWRRTVTTKPEDDKKSAS